MKKRRTRRLLSIAVAAFVLASCAGTPEASRPVLSREQVAVQDVRTLLEEGDPYTALQLLDASSHGVVSLPPAQVESLRLQAIDEIEALFRRHLEAEEFERAFYALQALETVGARERVEDWSLPDILMERADRLYAAGDVPAALSVAYRVLAMGEAPLEFLKTYAARAAEHGQLAASEILREELVRREGVGGVEELPEPPGVPTPAEMVSGTVTIWVNRGLRLQSGVGYPDRVIGSGFFIDPRGYIITNHHVIQSEVDPEYEGYSRLFIRMSDSARERIPARVVGYDPVFDIALLKAEVAPPFVASFDPAEDVEPGERIIAIGSPLGLENTVTSGIVSATGRRFLQMGEAMQVDVPINPGSSGGPLYTDEGKLVGVVFAGAEQYEGINFAIPASWVVPLLPQLYRGGKTVHAWLGAAANETRDGLEIMYVVPGEPAELAGLAQGDTLVAINGRSVPDLRSAQRALVNQHYDTLISLRWRRGDREHQALVSPAERPESPVEFALTRDSRENLFVPLFGMELEQLSSMLWEKRYTITRVYKGLPADETGLSVSDPLTVQRWRIDEDQRLAILQIFVKKRRAGFLESVVQMVSFLDLDFFL